MHGVILCCQTGSEQGESLHICSLEQMLGECPNKIYSGIIYCELMGSQLTRDEMLVCGYKVQVVFCSEGSLCFLRNYWWSRMLPHWWQDCGHSGWGFTCWKQPFQKMPISALLVSELPQDHGWPWLNTVVQCSQKHRNRPFYSLCALCFSMAFAFQYINQWLLLDVLLL